MSSQLIDTFLDVSYVVGRYCYKFKRLPNIKKPKTFNEHIARKKLIDRDITLTKLADKVAVRDYVTERIGEKYLTKVLSVVDDPKKIDFDLLPNSFVIKATHGSGFTTIVKDKSQLNYADIIEECQKWLATNYYTIGREWFYKDIPPRILIEELLQTGNGEVPPDYKFFCFSGVPTFIQIDIDRFTQHKRGIYDTQWNKLPVALHYEAFDWSIDAPPNLDEMVSLAAKLSSGLDFVRVDLYSINDKIIFGEMTHCPGNGLEKFIPAQYDLIFGQAWDNQAAATNQ